MVEPKRTKAITNAGIYYLYRRLIASGYPHRRGSGRLYTGDRSAIPVICAITGVGTARVMSAINKHGSEHRSTKILGSTKAQRKYRRKCARRLALYGPKPPKPEKVIKDKKPWSLIRIKRALAGLRNDLDRIDRLFCQESRPWRLAGFNTKAEWWAAHPDKRLDHMRPLWASRKHARDARIAGASGEFTAGQWYAKMKEYGYRCAYCGVTRSAARALGADLTCDHIMPMNWSYPAAAAHIEFNCIDNIAPACRSCNYSKGPKHPMRWIWDSDRALSINPLVMSYYATLRDRFYLSLITA